VSRLPFLLQQANSLGWAIVFAWLVATITGTI
jgi:hypothetical protein